VLAGGDDHHVQAQVLELGRGKDLEAVLAQALLVRVAVRQAGDLVEERGVVPAQEAQEIVAAVEALIKKFRASVESGAA